MRVKSWALIALILTLGLALRLINLWHMPLYGDELTMVYDSYSILKTGMDQTGEVLPLTFRMGAGRPAGYVYFSIPFVAIFGPGVWGVRGLSLLSGLGVITLMYFLGKKLINEQVALTAALLAAISPWEIYLSRGGFEAHFALFLALLGITLFVYAARRPWLYVGWALSWGLAIHTYPTFKLTLPLVLVALLFYSGNIKTYLTKRLVIASLVILAVFGVLALKETLWGNSETRFLNVNIFADQTIREHISQLVNYDRSISRLPDFVKPVFYNKPLYYGITLTRAYFTSLGDNFLFLQGDRNPRHNPGEMGMLYLIDLPLLFIGLGYLWFAKKKVLYLLVAWILITPLATMFLLDPHGLRNALMLPAFLLISAYALSKLTKPLRLVAYILIAIELIYILERVYFLAPNKYAGFWSFPAKRAAEVIIDEGNDFDAVVVSPGIDNIEYAYPVYAQLNPRDVIAQYNSPVKKYGNVEIANVAPTDKRLTGMGKVLLIYPRVVNSIDLIPDIAVYKVER